MVAKKWFGDMGGPGWVEDPKTGRPELAFCSLSSNFLVQIEANGNVRVWGAKRMLLPGKTSVDWTEILYIHPKAKDAYLKVLEALFGFELMRVVY